MVSGRVGGVRQMYAAEQSAAYFAERQWSPSISYMEGLHAFIARVGFTADNARFNSLCPTRPLEHRTDAQPC
jgi:hypothetical protein